MIKINVGVDLEKKNILKELAVFDLFYVSHIKIGKTWKSTYFIFWLTKKIDIFARPVMLLNNCHTCVNCTAKLWHVCAPSIILYSWPGPFWYVLNVFNMVFMCQCQLTRGNKSHHNQGFSLEYYGSENAFFAKKQKQKSTSNLAFPVKPFFKVFTKF